MHSASLNEWPRFRAGEYTPYVAHRLTEITELTNAKQWRWVPTDKNVADAATRAGNTALTSTNSWFRGPRFLLESPDTWPQESVGKSTTISREIVAHATEVTPLIDVTRFSSYTRCARTLARVLLFVAKCRKQPKCLDVTLIEQAERLLLKQAQRESFADEIKALDCGRGVPRTSRAFKLNVCIDEDGLLRLRGRINAADVPEIRKRPVLLDGKHPLTRLIVLKEHRENAHIGREHVVNNLRQKYWVIGIRAVVKSVIGKCVTCTVKRRNPSVPIKGNLPRVRLDMYSRPFASTGVDCFGPMTVTVGRRREKRWGMLFTCMTTRAIHLEILHSLSTDSAIMALRRMAARRGWPAVIMSDNGTNFRGSDVELRRAYAEWLPELEGCALGRRTKWRFIDPGAPNQGGSWERQIRTVKSALSVILNEQAPRDEVLQTLMNEVEFTVNSRPLTHVSVDPEDPEALTPNHFLLGTADGMPVLGSSNRLDRRVWRVSQALADAFWARWVREYLPTLTPRGDAVRSTPNVKEGDVVLITDGILPRNVWPLGQVERVYEGTDKVVRSADVRTKGGILRRPVRRLVVLPINEGSEVLRRGEDVTDDNLIL
ncbi:uncharacterized protein LOC123694585 [Colias croceus]|uniref:uncharacterized protein LOC123694585 n=1 Tax=Colias crocea TaxID=72248 RepID=UPI001E27DEAA|nr:uncharacterized protein LOC123694585 [Colias croceus]